MLLITNEMHYDPPPLAPGDISLVHPWRSRAGMAEGRAALARARRFRPDVVVTEEARDPRFLALALAQRGAPIIYSTHDHRAHDAANARAPMARLSIAALDRRCALEVTFSEFVASHRRGRGHPVAVVPLTSEMAESMTPQVMPAEGRRDFLAIGRLSAYKNIRLCIEAFQLHRQSPAYRGDRLVLVGKGDPGCHIPDEVEWIDERYSFETLVPRLAAAKASLVMYSTGSQSGVQVINMQCGTRSLVSPVGGFPEYLPDGERPISIDGPEALAAAFDELADPERAAFDGALNQERYQRIYSASASGQAWSQVLQTVT